MIIINRIICYTDASYSNGNSGVCFHINSLSETNKLTIIYGNCKSKSALQSELQAIIIALKFILINKFYTLEIEIRTDCIIIVDIMQNKIYKEWDRKNWRKAKGKRLICDCCDEIFMIKKMVEFIGEDRVKFVKVKSYKDLNNRIADKYASFARKMDSIKINWCYKLEIPTDCNKVENTKQSILFELDVSNLGLVNMEKPWEKNKLLLTQSKNKSKIKIKWYTEEMKSSIVHIDSNLITLQEDVHLKCKEIDFNGILAKVAKDKAIDIPLLVREIANNKYVLVFNIRNYLISKALNIERVPCIITDLNHSAFAEFLYKRSFD